MEIVDKFDNKRRPLNKTSERYEKNKGEYRQSMHVWIQNSNGGFLIQKRAMTKKVFPGKWSITGGAVDSGETSLDTLVRECKEELGVDVDINKAELLMTLKRDLDFVDIYLLRQDFEIENMTLQKEEVDEAVWISRGNLNRMVLEDSFAISVSYYYDMFMKQLDMFAGRENELKNVE